MALKLSNEGIDVGNIVKVMLNPDPFLPELIFEIYRIGDVGVNFTVQGGTVIMRLVEKQP